MKFHEDHAVQEIKRVEVVCCDRCGAKAPIDYSDVSKWFEARTWLLASSSAEVTYHLCPGCRMALGSFMEYDGLALWERELLAATASPIGQMSREQIIERLADILYPMDEYADTQWNGGDVCEALATLVREVAPWAEKRQPEGPDDAFEAYKRERERLGL
jgi:hypothetical protein